MYGGFGLTLTGLAARQGPGGTLDWAALSLLAGSLVFSGTVAALALGAPRWLGAVTPIGGVLLVAGFALLGVSALRS